SGAPSNDVLLDAEAGYLDDTRVRKFGRDDCAGLSDCGPGLSNGDGAPPRGVTAVNPSFVPHTRRILPRSPAVQIRARATFGSGIRNGGTNGRPTAQSSWRL